MDRRRVLFLLGLGGPGLWLTDLGLFRLSSDFVVELDRACSFCHLSCYRMAGVPGLPHRICEHCAWLAFQIVVERLAEEQRGAPLYRGVMASQPPKPRPCCPCHCSFCDRCQREVHTLIAGPNVYICDACAGRANTLIDLA